MRIDVGTDVGGTFTDLWAITDDGRQIVVKSPSTRDIVTGILGAVELAASDLGMSAGEFCSSIERFGHGTTAGLNALLTGNAARTGIITTRGFRDTLEIGRLKRQVSSLTDLQLGDYVNRGRVPSVVPRQLVMEVDERIDRNGDVVVALDPASLDAAIDRLIAAGVEAVAVCTLWSVVNPEHERIIGEAVARRMPDVFLSLSHEIAPGLGEYARMSTTATNAAMGPIMGAYLTALDESLRDLGLRVPVLVMTGAGGVVPAPELAREPVAALTSGPAAGVIACQHIGARLGYDRILTIDVGGTSFDVGTVVDGVPAMRHQVTLGGADIQRPAIDVGTIGAGGGSIARVENGALHVGPQSAGAVPGPVCYGRGGVEVTATDADLVLGTLAEDGFAGGQMTLDKRAATEAIRERIAEPLGLSTMEAAWGVRQVLDSKMADLLRSVTIERGHDPREFVMFANGGQGPTHAWALCQELGIGTFVVTPTATAQSALGTGTSDLRQSAERPAFIRLATGVVPSDEAIGVLDTAVREARDSAVEKVRLASAGAADVTVECSLAMRYRGQAHHLDVALDEPSVTRAAFDDAVSRFEAQYEALFGAGSAFREAGLEVLSSRALATVSLSSAGEQQTAGDVVIVGSRQVVFDDPDDPVDCPIWQTNFPAAGHTVGGPALVTFPGQTLVIPPGATAHTDEMGNFIVRLHDAGHPGIQEHSEVGA